VDAQDNLYVTDHSNETIRVITPAGVVSTLAGDPGVVGTNDGVGAQAQFNGPHGIALDSAGNVFVTDIYNDTIREITPGGMVTTIAGLAGVSGWRDGNGTNALFADSWGVAVDSAGNLFVSDTGNFVIRKITPVGTNWIVSTIAGLPGFPGSSDGTNNKARFFEPDGLVVDGAGDIFVADESPQTDCIREITPVGTNWVVTTIAGHGGQGFQDGIGTNAFFQGPTDVARDTNGNLYVTDIGNQVIREIGPVGTNWSVSTIAGSFEKIGAIDGTGVAARFYNPHGITVDNSGNLFVVQGGNEIVSKGWVAGTMPAASLNTLQITNNQAQFNLTVITGFPTNLTVLQADQATGPWITNASAVLITNISGVSYNITAPFATNSSGFYRMQLQ
jgi:sugar lactone lactonase YvrE